MVAICWITTNPPPSSHHHPQNTTPHQRMPHHATPQSHVNEQHAPIRGSIVGAPSASLTKFHPPQLLRIDFFRGSIKVPPTPGKNGFWPWLIIPTDTRAAPMNTTPPHTLSCHSNERHTAPTKADGHPRLWRFRLTQLLRIGSHGGLIEVPPAEALTH